MYLEQSSKDKSRLSIRKKKLGKIIIRQRIFQFIEFTKTRNSGKCRTAFKKELSSDDILGLLAMEQEAMANICRRSNYRQGRVKKFFQALLMKWGIMDWEAR